MLSLLLDLVGAVLGEQVEHLLFECVCGGGGVGSKATGMRPPPPPPPPPPPLLLLLGALQSRIPYP